jgi:protein phosphatase 1G
MGNENKALFGVFDGHGGREVAIYCGNHYIDILSSQRKLIDEISTAEWLRRSFLDVDTKLRADDGKKEIADLRKEKPPKKSPIL